MPKGITDSFSDGVAKLLSEVGRLRAYPDADDGILDQVQEVLVQHVRAATSPAVPGMEAGMGGQMPPDLASLLGAPPQGQSRGPIPGLNSREAGAAFERALAGQTPTG